MRVDFIIKARLVGLGLRNKKTKIYHQIKSKIVALNFHLVL